MRTKKILFLGLVVAFISGKVSAQSEKTPDELFEYAAEKYKKLMMLLPDDKFPKTFEDGRLITSNSDWWCSGFYPGTLLYTFEETGDSVLYVEALHMLDLLEKEQYNTSTHDLGFMMYCSFGNANRINPKPKYDEILLNSARSLSTRFNPTVGCIKSWDSHSDDFLVIIDNMMNLELLFWATKQTGDSMFHKIAVTHADNTLRNHFRPDNSSYHVVNYNPQTGEVQNKRTHQGLADESAWSRGQAWGLYGYTMTYRETGERKYLDQAEKIANFILTHPNLPEDKIPYWDFDAEPGPETQRDASAAAIIASALLELQNHTKSASKASFYLANAKEMLQSLSSPTYLSEEGENGGFLIKHCVGHLTAGSEVDVPLTYADYYFIEALKRYYKAE